MSLSVNEYEAMSPDDKFEWQLNNPPPSKEKWSAMSKEEQKGWKESNPVLNAYEINLNYIPGKETEKEQEQRLAAERRALHISNEAKRGNLEPLAVMLAEKAATERGLERVNAEKVVKAIDTELNKEDIPVEKRLQEAEKKTKEVSATKDGNKSFADCVVGVLQSTFKVLTKPGLENFLELGKAIINLATYSSVSKSQGRDR